jgi:hypothetical protein
VTRNMEFVLGMVCGASLVGLLMIALKAFGVLT